MRWLLSVEAVGIVGFVGFVVASAVVPPPTRMPALDVAAMRTGPSSEAWVGIFLEGQHIGWEVNREQALEDGGRLYEAQSFMKIGTMGDVSQIVTMGTAVTDASGRLSRFDAVMTSPLPISATGEVRGNSVHVELTQAGATTPIDIDVADAPTMSMTLDGAIRGRTLTAGQSFSVPYFDPFTQSVAEMMVLVESEMALPDGSTGWWLRTTRGAMATRRLVTEQGDLLREESEMGFSTVRMTRDEAMAIDASDPPDLVAMTSVPLHGAVARGATKLRLKVTGVPISRIAAEPGLQQIDGSDVIISVPDVTRLPDLQIAGTEEIAPTPTLPAAHPEIVKKAQQVVGSAPTRTEAARRLSDFVFRYVAKKPTVGIPNGLEVLRHGEGDCNEHTALYVSLARAVGIPSRIAVGLVWSDRLGDAFYYHAWPEVLLGDGTDGVRWVPVDPTFGQFPADATHVKLLNGDLDRQAEIMGVMGRIRLDVVE